MKMKDNKKKTRRKKTRKNLNEFSLKEVVFITLAFIILSVSLTYVLTVRFGTGTITNNNLKDIIKSYNKITKYYYEDVNESELSSAAIKGMMTYLNDKYSIVLDTEDTTSLTNTLDGEYKGIGISMVRYENSYIVVEVFDNTPASKSGIKPGDKIIKIDGDPIDDNFDYNEYRNKLIKQDTVSLTIDRDNNTFNTVVDVKDVEIPIVYSEMFNKNNKNIGYIYLQTFNDNSYKQFKSELEKLEEKGIDSLIIDVRSNGGGLLDKCTNILELFIKEGKTLYGLTTKSETTLVKSTSNVDRNYPIVVLINEKSASASEVLAGAMKESYGATLIGKKSYGKGKVQQTASLSKKNMIKYTVANWTTPSGNSIDGVGINPGISVDLDKKYAEDPSIENDNQIQKAIEFLSKR